MSYPVKREHMLVLSTHSLLVKRNDFQSTHVPTKHNLKCIYYRSSPLQSTVTIRRGSINERVARRKQGIHLVAVLSM